MGWYVTGTCCRYLHQTAHLTVLVQRTLISIPVNNLIGEFRQSLGDPIGVLTWCLLNDLRLVGIFVVASDVRGVLFPDLDGLSWVWFG